MGGGRFLLLGSILALLLSAGANAAAVHHELVPRATCTQQNFDNCPLVGGIRKLSFASFHSSLILFKAPATMVSAPRSVLKAGDAVLLLIVETPANSAVARRIQMGLEDAPNFPEQISAQNLKLFQMEVRPCDANTLCAKLPTGEPGFCNYGTCASIPAETWGCKCNKDCGTAGAMCGKPWGPGNARVCTTKSAFWQNPPAKENGPCNACDGCAAGICDFGTCRTNSQVNWGCSKNSDCGTEPGWCCSNPDPSLPGSARHCTRTFSACPVPPKYKRWDLQPYCYALQDENSGDNANPRLARTCNKPGQMAITFDDGFNGDNNGNLLEKKTQELVYSMTKDGFHEVVQFAKYELTDPKIADHTWSHTDMVLEIKSDDEMRFQIDTIDNAIYNITGWKPRFFRPPFGSFKLNTPMMQYLKNKNMINVLWAADTFDANEVPPADKIFGLEIYKRLFANCPAADTSFITLQHSSIQSTASDPAFIDQIAAMGRANGWTFVKLSECLGEAPYLNSVQGPVMQKVMIDCSKPGICHGGQAGQNCWNDDECSGDLGCAKPTVPLDGVVQGVCSLGEVGSDCFSDDQCTGENVCAINMLTKKGVCSNGLENGVCYTSNSCLDFVENGAPVSMCCGCPKTVIDPATGTKVCAPPSDDASGVCKRNCDSPDFGEFVQKGYSAFTMYWVSSESDYPAASTVPSDKLIPLKTCQGETLYSQGLEFAISARLEGTALLNDGRILNIEICPSCKTDSNAPDAFGCFFTIDGGRFPYGIGSKIENSEASWPLHPYVSIASNDLGRKIPPGSNIRTFFIPELKGIQVTGFGGKVYTHNGCVRLDDVGWSLSSSHVDWFVFREGNYKRLGETDGSQLGEVGAIKKPSAPTPCEVLTYGFPIAVGGDDPKHTADGGSTNMGNDENYDETVWPFEWQNQNLDTLDLSDIETEDYYDLGPILANNHATLTQKYDVKSYLGEQYWKDKDVSNPNFPDIFAGFGQASTEPFAGTPDPILPHQRLQFFWLYLSDLYNGLREKWAAEQDKEAFHDNVRKVLANRKSDELRNWLVVNANKHFTCTHTGKAKPQPNQPADSCFQVCGLFRFGGKDDCTEEWHVRNEGNFFAAISTDLGISPDSIDLSKSGVVIDCYLHRDGTGNVKGLFSPNDGSWMETKGIPFVNVQNYPIKFVPLIEQFLGAPPPKYFDTANAIAMTSQLDIYSSQYRQLAQYADSMLIFVSNWLGLYQSWWISKNIDKKVSDDLKAEEKQMIVEIILSIVFMAVGELIAPALQIASAAVRTLRGAIQSVRGVSGAVDAEISTAMVALEAGELSTAARILQNSKAWAKSFTGKVLTKLRDVFKPVTLRGVCMTGEFLWDVGSNFIPTPTVARRDLSSAQIGNFTDAELFSQLAEFNARSYTQLSDEEEYEHDEGYQHILERRGKRKPNTDRVFGPRKKGKMSGAELIASLYNLDGRDYRAQGIYDAVTNKETFIHPSLDPNDPTPLHLDVKTNASPVDIDHIIEKDGVYEHHFKPVDEYYQSLSPEDKAEFIRHIEENPWTYEGKTGNYVDHVAEATNGSNNLGKTENVTNNGKMNIVQGNKIKSDSFLNQNVANNVDKYVESVMPNAQKGLDYFKNNKDKLFEIMGKHPKFGPALDRFRTSSGSTWRAAMNEGHNELTKIYKPDGVLQAEAKRLKAENTGKIMKRSVVERIKKVKDQPLSKAKKSLISKCS
ncbi:Carbohydrate esterase 4 protein [Phlyctochytrium planicorne]|nr:Carbohydrate esterase 4 protein [Phlyctochytrium planicorne]